MLVWVKHQTAQHFDTFGGCVLIDHQQHPLANHRVAHNAVLIKTETMAACGHYSRLFSDFVNENELRKKSLTIFSTNSHLIFVNIRLLKLSMTCQKCLQATNSVRTYNMPFYAYIL